MTSYDAHSFAIFFTIFTMVHMYYVHKPAFYRYVWLKNGTHKYKLLFLFRRHTRSTSNFITPYSLPSLWSFLPFPLHPIHSFHSSYQSCHSQEKFALIFLGRKWCQLASFAIVSMNTLYPVTQDPILNKNWSFQLIKIECYCLLERSILNARHS